jgi:hypothetical protein
MGEICEPKLGKASLLLRNCYNSIPHYLRVSLASISYSVNIDRLESDYSGTSCPNVPIELNPLLLGRKSSGMDIYQCMGVYVSAIGHCMETWGVKQTLLYRLILAIKGQHNPSLPSWTRSVVVVSSVGQFDPDSLDRLWFDKPLLAMPLLDALALYLSAAPSQPLPSDDSSLSSSSSSNAAAVKWICVAYLVQCFVNEIHQLENRKAAALPEDGSEESSGEKALPEGWEIGPLFRVLYETVLLTKDEYLSSQTIWKSQLNLSPPLMESLFRRVLLKWIVFVRVAIRMTKRCDVNLYSSLRWRDDAVSVESLSGLITNEMLLQTIDHFQLHEIFSFSSANSSTSSPQHQHTHSPSSSSHLSIVTVATKWLHNLFAQCHGSVEFLNGDDIGDGDSSGASAVYDCLKFNQWHYPTHTIPAFVELPNAYTKLHGQITSRCTFEYPAFCFVCGEIMDAGLVKST